MIKDNASAPKLSIGLAVFNGENYIRNAIDSILGQSFRDFELILCDNASTDSTPTICQEYVDRDSRVRYVRNDNNIGLSPNLSKVFSLASGEYFKWAAHDDFISVDYLQSCVDVLDSNPDVVLCQARVEKVDPHGNVLHEAGELGEHSYVQVEQGLCSDKVYDRLVALQNDPGGWLQVYGVIRRAALLKTDLFGGYPEDDHVLLTQLALQGRIYTDRENTFFSRDHSGQSVAIGRRSMHQFAIWLSPDKKGKLFLPQWELVTTYVKALTQYPQSGLSKLHFLLASLLFIRGKFSRLLKDVYIAVLQVLDFSLRKLLGSLSNIDSDALIWGRYPRIDL